MPIYAEHVTAYRDAFGVLQKCALDLASILDGNRLKPAVEPSWKAKEKALLREELFSDFCTVCVRSGVPVPPLESFLLEAHLRGNDPQAALRLTAFLTAVDNRLDDSTGDATKNIRAIMGAARYFSEMLNDYPGITWKEIECAVNRELLRNGLKPILPDYAARHVALATDCTIPQKPTVVLIVDDNEFEIVRTERALAGWPNIFWQELAIDEHVIENAGPRGDRNVLEHMARTISASHAHIVLMDEDLGNILKGSEITKAIFRSSKTRPIIVANTNGSDTELLRAGAIANFEKGGSLAAMEQAVKLLW